MKKLLLRWQSIIAALVGFALSVAWEVEIFSSVTQYPFTWFFGAVAVVLLVWGVVDAVNEQRPRRSASSSSDGEDSTSAGGGEVARRLDKIEQKMERMDDQVQELRREEL